MSKDKITIIPPSKKNLTEAAKDLRKGKGDGGRTMADASIAKKQDAKHPKK